jgi:hypothetical protein
VPAPDTYQREKYWAIGQNEGAARTPFHTGEKRFYQ